MTGSVNTGTTDREGRTIYKGARGGYFVRKGASGKKVYRKTTGAGINYTGAKNALGRAIIRGPRGGLYVLVHGKRRQPAKGRNTLSPSSSPVTQKLMAYMKGRR